MRLSTSAFDVVTPARAIVLLLVAIAVYFLMLEFFAREFLPRISADQGRIMTDGRAALSVRPTDTTGARTILLVGNSLLVRGIDRQQLGALMGSDYHVTLFPVENTTYLDWFYGLRRLLAGGARPSVVVLCISAKHLLSDATDGEGFAYLLMQLRDLPDVARDTHLNMMTASAYFFANVSAWLGTRSTFRDGLMLRWLPGALLLAPRLSVVGPQWVANTESEQRAVERLSSLRALAAQYHAKFIWLLPPTLYTQDLGPALAAAAAREQLSVLLPSKPGTLPSSAFADGFHLNPAGAAQYTPLAVAALRQELATTSWPAEGDAYGSGTPAHNR